MPAESWRKVAVRDTEKGPLPVAIVTRRVVAMMEEKVGDEELLVVVRWTDEDGTLRHDYHFSNARTDTPLEAFARVARAEHRIEQCFERGKSDAGLAEYQVRTWLGWHHHVTLSLLATWFLIGETRRGKKWTPAISIPQVRKRLAQILRCACGCDTPARIRIECTRWLQRNELARFYHHKRLNVLPNRKFNLRC